jgi:hypothetical protein
MLAILATGDQVIERVRRAAIRSTYPMIDGIGRLAAIAAAPMVAR